MNLQDAMLFELDRIAAHRLKDSKTTEQKLAIVKEKLLIGGTLHKILGHLDLGTVELEQEVTESA